MSADSQLELEQRINNIKILYNSAKKKEDYDFIIKKFNIKCKKNNKIASCLYLKLPEKKKIIKMSFEEPEDIFDYDYFSMINCNKKIIPSQKK